MLNLVLDTQIRDWVLLPIVVVVFLSSFLRYYISILIRSEKKKDLKATKDAQTLLRARRLKVCANKLPPMAFQTRKAIFNDKENGLFKEKTPNSQDPLNMGTNPMLDPNNMMDMMKNNMTMIIPQMLMMAWVSYFFTGFVLVKLPFPLTLSFKTMLQRGIDLSTLDVAYVSSLSWYFLVVFGLRGLSTIFLGEVSDETQMMQQQMQGMNAAAQMDTQKIFQSERENIELLNHQWELENVEQRLLERIKGESMQQNANRSSNTIVSKRVDKSRRK